MNCRRFQNELYEYLEGSLSPKARAAAEQHLSECVACREKVKEERQVAQAMGDSFRRATERLELSPSVSRRVLAELAKESSAATNDQPGAFFWHRWAWPSELAASMLLLLGLWALVLRGPGHGGARQQSRGPQDKVSVQLSCIVPAYTFRLEGGFVTDALSYQTNVVDETLPAHPARSH